MTDTEKRIAALEERIAHQERTIEDLSYISVKQWKEISDLSDKIGYLKRSSKNSKPAVRHLPGRNLDRPITEGAGRLQVSVGVVFLRFSLHQF